MRLDSSFWWGVGVGLAGAWAFHRYVKPVPSPKQA